MDVKELSRAYDVRVLTDADVPSVLALCEGNPLYYEHCPPAPSAQSIREDMRALPEGKRMRDKFYLGFYSGGALIAVTDLILRFPDDETAFIGFFMADKRVQGRGVGSAIVAELLSRLGEDFRFVRLGYVRGNEQSRRFWIKNGFEPTGVTTRTQAYEIVVMQRALRA